MASTSAMSTRTVSAILEGGSGGDRRTVAGRRGRADGGDGDGDASGTGTGTGAGAAGGRRRGRGRWPGVVLTAFTSPVTTSMRRNSSRVVVVGTGSAAAAVGGEEILHGVGGAADGGQLDHPGGALEGVGQAQHAGEGVPVARALLQRQDALGEPLEELARLDPEVLVGSLAMGRLRRCPQRAGFLRRWARRPDLTAAPQAGGRPSPPPSPADGRGRTGRWGPAVKSA